VAGLAGR